LTPGQLNSTAFGVSPPKAIESSKRADAELASGLRRGPLHGAPFLLKDDIFTVDGSFCSSGSRALEKFFLRMNQESRVA